MRDYQRQISELRNRLSALRMKGDGFEEDFRLGRPWPNIRLEPWILRRLRDIQAVVWMDVARFRNEDIQNIAAQNQAVEEAEKASLTHIEDDNRRAFLGSALLNLNLESDLSVPANLTGIDPSVFNRLDAGAQRLYHLIQREIDEASLGTSGTPASILSLQKMKKALHTFVEGRIGDAITILRTGRQDDPSSRSMAYILSQMLYYRSHHGNRTFLPEAREEAKRACTFDEKFDPLKLLHYRYHFAASEFFFDPQRALEIMRDYYLHSPEAFAGAEGLAAHEGIHLKAMLLLAAVPDENWTEYDIECIASLASQPVGGALFYIHFFRPLVLQRLEESKPGFEPLLQVEQNLQEVILRFENTLELIKQHYGASGQPLNTGTQLWTVKTRFLSLFLGHTPLPSLDDLLSNTSLNGRHYTRPEKLNAILKGHGLNVDSFWAVWAQRVTYDSDIRRVDILPVETVARDAVLFPEYESLLATLRREEDKLINPDRWNVAEKFITPFSYDKVLEIGTGRSTSLTSRGPGDTFYRAYYQAWNSNIRDRPRPSDMLEDRAVVGAFWNLEEIQAAFDGLERLVDDPVVGLEVRQRVGYRKYLQNQDSEQRNREDRQERIGQHMRDFWWFYFVLVPLSCLTFVVVVSSQSYSNAIMTLALLFTIFGFGGWLIYRVIQGSPKTGSAPKTNEGTAAPAQKDETSTSA